MKQRLLSVCMALLLILTLLPPEAVAQQEDPDAPDSILVTYTPAISYNITLDTGETVPATSVPYALSLGEEASKEYLFTAAVKNQDGDVLTDQTVEWSCDTGDGITFIPSGNTARLVIASSALKAYDNSHSFAVTITAACGAAVSAKSVAIYVPTRKAQYIQIFKDGTPITADSIAPGGSASYIAKIYDQYGVEMDGRDVTNSDDGALAPMAVPPIAWSVDNSAVTVSGGTVTVPDGVLGAVRLTASAGSVSATADITVQSKGAHQLTAPEDQVLVYGETVTVSAASSTGATGFTYTSSRPDIVEADGSGLLTAKKPGSATITVHAPESDGYTAADASFTVTVTAKELTASLVTLDSTQFVYNAQEQIPSVTIAGLTEGTDYTVTSECGSHPGSACQEAGSHSLKIQGIGNYTGAVTETFTIVQATPEVTAFPAAVPVKVGGTATFYVAVTGVAAPGGAEGEKLTSQAVTVSTDPAVLCTVGEAGADKTFPVTVTGREKTPAAGVTLTVTYPGSANYSAKTALVTVTVSDREPAVTKLTLGGLTDGKAVNGTVLTARHEASPGAALTYQWLRDGTAIPGADSAAYTVTADDIGHQLSVRVSGGASYIDVTSGGAEAVGISVQVALTLEKDSVRTGGTTTASAVVTATNGAFIGEVAGGTVTYASSDTSVAVVDPRTGVITALEKPGTASITARFALDGYMTTASSAVPLIVEERAPLNVTIADVSVAVGGAAALAPVVTAPDGLAVLTADMDYEAAYSLPADSGVAEIADGIVIGRNTGEVAVTVTVTPKSDGAYAADCRAAEKTFLVTVTDRSAAPEETVAAEDPAYTGSALTPADAATVPAPGTEPEDAARVSVSGGTATVEVPADAVEHMVQQAADGSSTAVIAPEVPSGVVRTEISVPSSAISAIAEEADAALRVETPAASVTISNDGLISLSGQGGSVVISTENAEGAVSIEIAVDGRPVDTVPGGVMAEIPAACGPGTVARLVDSQGNILAAVRKSFADGDVMHVPLSGSAKIVFTDSSKRFPDVPAEDRDAVDFASGHELMNGVGGGVFDPGGPMTRGMLAVVLHNLEGNPDAVYRGGFGDVADDAWYAAAVQWAADRRIINGVDTGVFSPGATITREQLAVMLYRYAGQPAADGAMGRFNDASDVSAWAREAVAWAASSGIISVSGGALRPQGAATRAEAAQILMRFVTSGVLGA